MYYSRHNKNVIFDSWYPGPYTLYGHILTVGAPVSYESQVSVFAEDLEDTWPGSADLKDCKTLVIKKSVCRVGPGFIESFPLLKDLIVEADLETIECTPELEKLLKNNNVILRGRFNSPAELLADKLGLPFVHINMLVDSSYDEGRCESSRYYLCFQLGEPPFIWVDITYPGISAGNNGGGTVRTDWPADFFMGRTVGDFTGKWNKVSGNETFRSFLEEANRRGKLPWI